MPIRLNLLAEALAAEEARRKDPVKRAILAGLVLVAGVLLWASSLQLKLMAARGQLGNLEVQWRAIEKAYQAAEATQRQAREVQAKLDALAQLHTNRFLWGSALNAFQQTLNGVDHVQVTRFKSEQTFVTTEAVPAKPGVPGRPATATEKTTFTIEAIDSSPQPGRDQVVKFRDAISQVPWFQAHLQKTNGVTLTSLSAPQVQAGRPPFVMFTLQCNFAEKTR